ncbi:MAG: hypothetical protein J4N34_02065 [Chloroflexi bacterium]|nr:hypothetical protein [Chloroflexota bacterium]
MTKETDTFADGEIAVEDYLRLLLRWWWVILTVMVAVLVVVGLTSPSKQPDVYQARTTVFLSDHASDGEALNYGGLVPQEIVAALATSDAVLDRVSEHADVQNGAAGLSALQGRLAGVANIEIQNSGNLTEMTLTVRDGDPGMARRILEIWAETFVGEYRGLLETEVARAQEFVAAGREEAEKELAAREKALVATEEEKLIYQHENLTLVLINGLQLSMSQLQGLTRQLSLARGELIDVGVRLDSIRSALVLEPETIALDQKIEDDTLATLLAQGIKNLGPVRYPDLIVPIEVPNDVHRYFRTLVILLEAQQATLAVEIEFVEEEIASLNSRIREESAEIETQELEILRFDRKITLLEQGVSGARQDFEVLNLPVADKSSPYFVVEAVAEPAIPIPTTNPLNRRLLVGGLVGAILGVVAAVAVDYIQRLRKARRGAALLG